MQVCIRGGGGSCALLLGGGMERGGEGRGGGLLTRHERLECRQNLVMHGAALIPFGRPLHWPQRPLLEGLGRRVLATLMARDIAARIAAAAAVRVVLLIYLGCTAAAVQLLLLLPVWALLDPRVLLLLLPRLPLPLLLR